VQGTKVLDNEVNNRPSEYRFGRDSHDQYRERRCARQSC
jgi:hypothetical protein